MRLAERELRRLMALAYEAKTPTECYDLITAAFALGVGQCVEMFRQEAKPMTGFVVGNVEAMPLNDFTIHTDRLLLDARNLARTEAIR